MLFPTVEFAFFFLLAFGLAWGTVGHHLAHKRVLLMLSYFFYGFWDWHFLPLLFTISLYSWVAAKGIERGKYQRLWLVGGIIACLTTLAWYKYLGFFLQNFLNLTNVLGIELQVAVVSPILPLGISFMIFHAISLMVDVWRGKFERTPSLEDVLLYVAFFPHLIAGPILRASQFIPQLQKAPDPRRIETSRALLLIAIGLFKKVVIANNLATLLVDEVFANPQSFSASQVMLSIYGYAAQIYCDFSGYTDIAIGCALLLGYRLPDNFDNPYRSASPQEFWRRWHISLSIWLREYVFIPLGGSRQGKLISLRNLLITMLLGGLWHGAAWNFIIWGFLHGLLLAVHRVWDNYWYAHGNDRWRKSELWCYVSRFMLFHAVCLGWIFFRSSDLGQALVIMEQVVAGEWYWDFAPGMLLCIVLGIGMHYLPSRVLLRLQLVGMRMPAVVLGALFAIALSVIEILGPSAPAPFIYFQF